MQPLKITAVMQDGRVGGTEPWFPLDSILAAEWMRINHPEAYYNASSYMLTNDMIIAELPFERRGAGDDWYWACSFNVAPRLGEYVLHWHKRFDDHLEKHIDFGKRRGRINIKSDRYKAYRMPVNVQLFDRMEWYAVGDQAAVLGLCRGVTHIGKKSSQGLGAVDYWVVEPCQEDLSGLRAIPAHGQTTGRLAQYGIRPPYWHSDHQRICVMPEVHHG